MLRVLASVATVLLLLAAAVAATGCRSRARSAYGNVQTMDARQVERLRRVGERDMRCGRGDLVMVPMTQNAVELRGCGRIREYSLVCRRGRRCNWQPMTPAAMLATQDLGCPLESMSVAAPSASTRDLLGCGRTGRYAIACVEDAVCRWNLLGPVALDATVAPPAAYGGGYAPPEGGSIASVEVQGPTTASITVSVGEVPPPPP